MSDSLTYDVGTIVFCVQRDSIGIVEKRIINNRGEVIYKVGWAKEDINSNWMKHNRIAELHGNIASLFPERNKQNV